MKTFNITEGEITGISLVEESPYGKEYNFITMNNWIPQNNDLSYYPLLKEAIDATKGTVLELGTGHGSTELLHNYLKDRKLKSFEEKKEWLDKFIHFESDTHELYLVDNWRALKNFNADVIFIDHAPGEDRKQMILDFKDTKGIIVCHDTEPAADHGYQMRQHFPLFKFVVEVKTNGAWATAMSNEIDVTKWIGIKYGSYEISAYRDK